MRKDITKTNSLYIHYFSFSLQHFQKYEIKGSKYLTRNRSAIFISIDVTKLFKLK